MKESLHGRFPDIILRFVELVFVIVSLLVASCSMILKPEPESENPTLSSEKTIQKFDFDSINVAGVVGQEEHTITLSVPYGTDLSAIAPIIQFSGDHVTPASGVAQDFRSAVTYTVFAKDSSSVTYSVRVLVLLRQSPDVNITWFGPNPGTIFGDTARLQLRVASTYLISSVQAELGGRVWPLSSGNFQFFGLRFPITGWGGEFSISDIPRGAYGLRVTATDVYQNVTEYEVAVKIDRAGTIDIATPAEGSVARNHTLHVVATAHDDDSTGPVSFLLRIGDNTVVRSTSTIDADIDLTTYEGKSVLLSFVCTDSAGQEVVSSRTVFVETSSNLAVKAALPGKVIDYSDHRILYSEQVGTLVKLCMLDTNNNSTHLIFSGTLHGNLQWEPAAWLGPSAVFYGGLNDYSLHELDTSTFSDSIVSAFPWRSMLAGHYLAYQLQSSDRSIQIRDYAGGSTLLIESAWPLVSWTLTDDGTVFYIDEAQMITRWKNGVTTQFPNPLTGNFTSYSSERILANAKYLTFETARLLVSGINWATQYTCYLLDLRYNDGTTAPQWTELSNTSLAGIGGDNIIIGKSSNGQISYWQTDLTSEQQLEFFSGATPELVVSDGSFLFTSNTEKRFLWKNGQPLIYLGSTLGTPVERNGEIGILLGNNVLSIAPETGG